MMVELEKLKLWKLTKPLDQKSYSLHGWTYHGHCSMQVEGIVSSNLRGKIHVPVSVNYSSTEFSSAIEESNWPIWVINNWESRWKCMASCKASWKMPRWKFASMLSTRLSNILLVVRMFLKDWPTVNSLPPLLFSTSVMMLLRREKLVRRRALTRRSIFLNRRSMKSLSYLYLFEAAIVLWLNH